MILVGYWKRIQRCGRATIETQDFQMALDRLNLLLELGKSGDFVHWTLHWWLARSCIFGTAGGGCSVGGRPVNDVDIATLE